MALLWNSIIGLFNRLNQILLLLRGFMKVLFNLNLIRSIRKTFLKLMIFLIVISKYVATFLSIFHNDQIEFDILSDCLYPR